MMPLMTFEQMRLSCADFTQEMSEKLKEKMPSALRKAQELDFIPYTVKDGAWQPGPFDGICWWTNGFWRHEGRVLLTRPSVWRTQSLLFEPKTLTILWM